MRLEAGRASGIRPIENIQITNGRLIGSGHFGDAYAVNAIVGDGGREHSKLLVLKRYREQLGQAGSAKRNAWRAVENYSRAKEIGLQVFPTFRLLEDEQRILMTSGHSPEWICLGSNEGSDAVRHFEQYGRDTIDDELSFIELVPRLFEQAEIASQHGITLDADGIFFLVNAKGKGLDFVVGDYDMLGQGDMANHQLQLNLAYMYVALNTFLKKNFDDHSSRLAETVAKEFHSRSGDDIFLQGLSAKTKKRTV